MKISLEEAYIAVNAQKVASRISQQFQECIWKLQEICVVETPNNIFPKGFLSDEAIEKLESIKADVVDSVKTYMTQDEAFVNESIKNVAYKLTNP